MAKRILTKIRLKEIASVDRPAHGEGARSVLIKAGPDEGGEDELQKRAMLTSATDGHSHSINCATYEGERSVGDTSGANSSTGQYHTHPWVMGEDGEVAIGENLGHTHEVAAMSKAEPKKKDEDEDEDEDDAIPWAKGKGKKKNAKKPAKEFGYSQQEDGALAESSGTADESASSEETTMANQTQPSAEELAKAADKKKVAELEKKLARYEALSSLSDAERSFSKSMAEPALDAFLALKPEARAAEIAKATQADPVVYKAMDGTEFRKSESRLAAMAERADRMEKAQIAAEVRLKEQEYQKRATTELPHLPAPKDGGADPRVDLLKAVDSIPDEARRKAAGDLLKAADAAMSPAFEARGKSSGKMSLVGSASEKIDALAKQYQVDHKEKSFAKAYAAVLETDEGRELYEKSDSEGAASRRGAV